VCIDWLLTNRRQKYTFVINNMFTQVWWSLNIISWVSQAEDLLQMQKCIQFVIVFIYKIRHPTNLKFAIKISNTLSVYR